MGPVAIFMILSTLHSSFKTNKFFGGSILAGLATLGFIHYSLDHPFGGTYNMFEQKFIPLFTFIIACLTMLLEKNEHQKLKSVKQAAIGMNALGSGWIQLIKQWTNILLWLATVQTFVNPVFVRALFAPIYLVCMTGNEFFYRLSTKLSAIWNIL